MRLQNLCPLAFLLCIPVIILIWMLKQKASDYPISSLFLWKEAYKNVEAANPWERFKNHLLMYLQILTVIALVLAMSAPYIPGVGKDFSHVVVALDTSGSMNAMYNGEQTRFEAACDEARTYIDSLSEDTSVSIVTLGAKNITRLASSTDKRAAREKIDELTPEDTAADIYGAIDFIKSMMTLGTDGAAALFTDQTVENAPDYMSVYTYVSSGPNAAVDYVSHSVTEDGITVLARITNYSDSVYEGDVNFYVDDELMDIGTVHLEANASDALYFKLQDSGGSIVKVQLHSADLLENDNVGYDILNESGDNSILLVSTQNIFLEKALSAIKGADVYKTSDGRVDKPFDTYIFDGIYPQELPAEGNLIFINPPANDSEEDSSVDFIKTSESVQNVWLSAADCRLMQYVYPFDLAVTDVNLLEKPSWATAFFKKGQECAGYYGNYGGRFIAVLGFDLHNTDFALQTHFPIFIHNLMELCKDSRLVPDVQATAGESLNINANPAGSDVMVRMPDGREILTDGNTSFGPVTMAGIYTFSQEVDGALNTALVHVDFPSAQESANSTAVLDENSTAAGKTAAMTGLGVNLRPLFIIICLVLLLAQWLIYLRRI